VLAASLVAMVLLGRADAFAAPVTINLSRSPVTVCDLTTTTCAPDPSPTINVGITYDPDFLLVTQPFADEWLLELSEPATFTVDRPQFSDPFGGPITNDTYLFADIIDLGGGLLDVASGARILDGDGCGCIGEWADGIDLFTLFFLHAPFPTSAPTAADFMTLLTHAPDVGSSFAYITGAVFFPPGPSLAPDAIIAPGSRAYISVVPEPPLPLLTIGAVALAAGWRRRRGLAVIMLR
jgi:hypothetical protein